MIKLKHLLPEIAGILKETLDERRIDVHSIDFSDDGNRDEIFTIDATEEDIMNFEKGNVKTVFETDDYGGTFGVYKLSSGEFMYAFPDAEFYSKAPMGTQIVGGVKEDTFDKQPIFKR